MAHGPIPDSGAKFPRPRRNERWKLQFGAWRRQRREDRFHEIQRIAEGAHAAGDIPAFEWCMRKLDRLGGRAWTDYLKRRNVKRDVDLASALERLGFECTPGQLRWIESVLPPPSKRRVAG